MTLMAGLSRIREARLRSDWRKCRELAARSPLMDVLAKHGDPPERYLLGFTCRSLVKQDGGDIGQADQHVVEIHLPIRYPRLDGPIVIHQSPAGLFHPNINANPGEPRVVCIGTFLPTQGLDEVCWRVFRILAAQNFSMDEDNALNREAAAYYRMHQDEFPTEVRPLVGRPEEVRVV